MRAVPLLFALATLACNGSTPGNDNDDPDGDTGATDSGFETDPPALGFGIDASGDHTCVHTSDGNLYCWGRNHVGQLGHGDNAPIGDNEIPQGAALVDVGAQVVDVAMGNLHTCALTVDGEVKCWGMGDNGQLGYGNTDEIGLTNLPSDVGTLDLGGPVAEIEAGGMYTCARLTDGGVKCWGQDYGGWLGQGYAIGTIGDDETVAGLEPIELGGAARRIAVGQVHACAVLTDDSLRCWGEGPASGHGDSSTFVGDNETPASAGDPLGEAVDDVWAGTAHTCAQLSSGGLRCWGDGMDFELGRPNPEAGMEHFGVAEIVEDPTLGPTHDFGEAVVDMALGIHYSCALLASGNVKCWGQHHNGVLGKGEVGSERVAVNTPDVPLGANATALAGQLLHNCALLGTQGDVMCWGSGEHGKLGYAATTDVGYENTPQSQGTVQYR
ncbi:MAG: hypothetical protein EP330_24860 [Deltaproteobacteria bacterium]|nr:MAG: hypothetical protein EP330_24860 [Deltaproteobacteria bacterium]